jgi:hypothetical protein
LAQIKPVFASPSRRVVSLIMVRHTVVFTDVMKVRSVLKTRNTLSAADCVEIIISGPTATQSFESEMTVTSMLVSEVHRAYGTTSAYR